MAEHPQGFDHVGLLFDESPEPAGLPFNKPSDEFNWRFVRRWMRIRTTSESFFIMTIETAMANELFLINNGQKRG